MYVFTKKFSYVINYVPFGTIGYIKTKDNEIRQCKCLGAKLVLEEGADAHCLQYEWKVGGMKEHLYGTESRLPIGIIYATNEYAQNGSATFGNKGELRPYAEFNIVNCLFKKYGMNERCFELRGTWNNCFSIRTYSTNKDHTSTLRPTDFEIIIDENGIDCRVPMLEGAVNGIRRYATEQKAYASMKPLKVYTLDDDDDDDVPTPTKVKVIIEVEISNLDNVKKYATIL